MTTTGQTRTVCGRRTTSELGDACGGVSAWRCDWADMGRGEQERAVVSPEAFPVVMVIAFVVGYCVGVWSEWHF